MAEPQAPALAEEELCKSQEDLEDLGANKTDAIEDDPHQCQEEKTDMPESTTAEQNVQNVGYPSSDQGAAETEAEDGETERDKEENDAKSGDKLKSPEDADKALEEPAISCGQAAEPKEENQETLLSQEKATDAKSPKKETVDAQPAGDDVHSKKKEDKPQPRAKDAAGPAKSGSQVDSNEKGSTAKASKDANREKQKERSDRSADLPRSRTMPKSYGSASKKDIAEKFGGVATSGIRVQRSTSSGANAVKNMLLEWCRAKTRGREGVDIQNFSSSWSDGLAFCALILAFFPDAFDYDSLDTKNRRQNFQLAFSTAEKMADCPPLLDVEDMVRMKVPDSKCVYTYVQELYRSLVAKGLVKTKKA
ncbi:smoothelin-like protein 1 [Gastrophryne carolinensis]